MKEYFIYGKGRSGKDLYFSGYLSSWNLPMWSSDQNDDRVIKFFSRRVAKKMLEYIKERYGYQDLKIVKRKDNKK